MPPAQCATSYHAHYAMQDDIEYRIMLARSMREAGASFEVIAEALRERTRLAHQRQRLQPSTKRVRAHHDVHCRQDVAAGMRHQKATYSQISTALNVSYAGARNLVQRAKKRAAVPTWLNGLDLRTANALLRAGFRSLEEVRDAVANGRSIERVKTPRMTMIQAWLQSAQ